MKTVGILLVFLFSHLVYAEAPPWIQLSTDDVRRDTGGSSSMGVGFVPGSGPGIPGGYTSDQVRAMSVPRNPTHFNNGAPFFIFQTFEAKKNYLNSHQAYQWLANSPNNPSRNGDPENYEYDLNNVKAFIELTRAQVVAQLPAGYDPNTFAATRYIDAMLGNINDWIRDTQNLATQRWIQRDPRLRHVSQLSPLTAYQTEHHWELYQSSQLPVDHLDFNDAMIGMWGIETPRQRQALQTSMRLYRERQEAETRRQVQEIRANLEPNQMHRAPSPSLEPSYPEAVLVPLLQRALLPLSETIIEIGVALAEYRAAHDYPTIRTPYGDATQDVTPEALAIREQVEGGATLYRIGTRATQAEPMRGSNTGDRAQFWSPENPNNTGYAQRYGIPEQNLAAVDFIERATMRPGSSYVVRQAPGVGNNGGGAYEVVIPENQGTIEIQSHGSL